MLKHLCATARTFYGELVDFMSRGPIVSAILEKDNAVEDFRTIIATNPADAAEGSIRKAYATLLAKMQFMVLIAMKCSYRRLRSILQEESSFSTQCSVLVFYLRLLVKPSK
jgi:nucleoside diphosphate kinase